LAYALVNPPTGVSIDANGVITWTPNQTQSPSTNVLTTIVSNTNPYDLVNPHLTATNSFVVTVNEVNSAPVFIALTKNNFVINAGTALTVTNIATDADIPAQTLTYRMSAGPAGATVNAATGVFSWRPTMTQAASTNLVTVVVSDNGMPSLSATQYFQITVNSLSKPSIDSLQFLTGHPTLTISGQLGPDYVVLVSTNLNDWQPTATNVSPASVPFQWSDTNSTAMPSRFYRIKLAP
jgi:Putative Ig domain